MAGNVRVEGVWKSFNGPRGAFDAVRDVTFEVRPGEAFGIVGRNGSGKSTLLKMMSGILRPSRGSIRVRGRVSPLLGIGAGFHHELTGKENIYLNGGILGMSKRDIDAAYPDIVGFSGLDGSIDVPVKRYSNGMLVRLGYAVARASRPSVLLVDEVLAAGDSEFRDRCLADVRRFLSDGGCLLLVAHQRRTVESHCRTVMWMDGGAVRSFGPAGEVLAAYEASVGAEAAGLKS